MLNRSPGPDSAGNSSLQESLLSLYPALLAFFRNRLPADRRDEAWDFAQEVLLDAWSRLSAPGGAQVRDLPSYVLGIARHKVNDALREGYLSLRVPLDQVDPDHLPLAVREASLDRRLEEDRSKARCLRALKNLRPLEREMLRLRFLDQVGNEEASKILGIEPEEGSRLKYRAIERLRVVLRIKKIPEKRAGRRTSEVAMEKGK